MEPDPDAVLLQIAVTSANSLHQLMGQPPCERVSERYRTKPAKKTELQWGMLDLFICKASYTLPLEINL